MLLPALHGSLAACSKKLINVWLIDASFVAVNHISDGIILLVIYAAKKQ